MNARPATLEWKRWHGRPVRLYANRARSLSQLLVRATREDPKQLALSTPTASYTYEELLEAAGRFGSALTRVPVMAGERMALLLPNESAWVVAFFGAAMAGVTIVPLDPRLAVPELQQLVVHCRAAALVTTIEVWGSLSQADFPDLQAVFAIDSIRGLNAPHLARDARNAVSPMRPPRRRTEHDAAMIFYTSGSTGSPKGAILTHSNVIHAAMNAAHCVGLNATSRNLIVAPLSHVAPCNAQLIATIACGGRVDLLASFGVESTAYWMAQRQVTHFFGVPSMYELLLKHPNFSRDELPELRSCAYGGAPCSPHLPRRLRAALGDVRLGHGFGLTETSSVALFLPDDVVDTKPTSVGWPCPVNDVQIVDELGRPVSPGEAGELLISGPTVFYGYDGDEAGHVLAKGSVRTGDIARMDTDGCVYIVDRMKDVIIRGGENIYCIEVENVLQSHPAVAEAALVGIPDPIMGEQCRAIVVPIGNQSVTSVEIRELCGRMLASYKVPKYVEVRSKALPRNRTGKVMKHLLRESDSAG